MNLPFNHFDFDNTDEDGKLIRNLQIQITEINCEEGYSVIDLAHKLIETIQEYGFIINDFTINMPTSKLIKTNVSTNNTTRP